VTGAGVHGVGIMPAWRPDGKELYGATLEPDAPITLLQIWNPEARR